MKQLMTTVAAFVAVVVGVGFATTSSAQAQSIELCKVYLNEGGEVITDESELSGDNTTFEVTGSDTNGNFSNTESFGDLFRSFTPDQDGLNSNLNGSGPDNAFCQRADDLALQTSYLYGEESNSDESKWEFVGYNDQYENGFQFDTPTDGLDPMDMDGDVALTNNTRDYPGSDSNGDDLTSQNRQLVVVNRRVAPEKEGQAVSVPQNCSTDPVNTIEIDSRKDDGNTVNGADTDDGFESIALTDGAEYFVKVTGTFDWRNLNGSVADARYSSTDGFATAEDPSNDLEHDLMIVGRNEDKSSDFWEWSGEGFNPAHEYGQTITGDGTTEQFYIYENRYGDNRGSLDVTIHRCNTEATGEIINPENDEEEVAGTTTLEATYDDNDNDSEDTSVDWAVRAGTCEVDEEATVAGDELGDEAEFNGSNFTYDFDTTEVENGDYCFVFNPDEDDEVSNDVRETREFTVNNEQEEVTPEPEPVVTTASAGGGGRATARDDDDDSNEQVAGATDADADGDTDNNDGEVLGEQDEADEVTDAELRALLTQAREALLGLLDSLQGNVAGEQAPTLPNTGDGSLANTVETQNGGVIGSGVRTGFSK